MSSPKYQRCSHGESAAPESLTAEAVRDMIVDCFTTAHGARFSDHRRELGMDDRRESVRRSVEDMVRLAFDQVGGDFDKPTANNLARVATLLAERSLAWGAPPDRVFENHQAMTRTVGWLVIPERDEPLC